MGGGGYICQLKPTKLKKKTSRNFFLIWGGGFICQPKTEIYLPKDFSILGGYICQFKSICDAWMTYRQAGRLTNASQPSFSASKHLTDKVGNPVEAGLTVWKDSTLPGHSKVFGAHIDMRLHYYF